MSNPRPTEYSDGESLGVRRTAFYAAALVILSAAMAAVYGPAAKTKFVFDDRYTVVDNPSIVRVWPLVGDSQFAGPLNPPNDLPTSGRPLVNLSLAVNYALGQVNPVGYHIFNIIVHILSALLLMAIVDRTLQLDYFGGRFGDWSSLLAFAVAMVWAVHPLQTETINYVTQRTELMVGFFYLATLYAALRCWGADSPASRTAWLVVATIACFAGMACKEMMVTAPVVVLLFERMFIAGSFREAWRRSWPLYVGLFLSWTLLWKLNSMAPRSDSAGFHLGVSAVTWWLTQTKVLWMYLKLAVWPWPLEIHYETPYLATVAAAWPWLLASLLLSVVTLVLLARRNAVGFVGAWVLIILSPTLVVPIVTEVAAERRMYLPLAALVALAVVGLAWCLGQLVGADKTQRNRAAFSWPAWGTVAFSLVLAVVFGLVSARRLNAYNNEITLWQDVVADQPNDFLAHSNLGLALVDAGRAQEAVKHCRQALLLRPDYPQAHYNLGNALAKLGHLDEAIQQYQQALQLNAKSADAHNNLGSALYSEGKYAEAIEEYRAAINLKPTYSEAYFNLGTALFKVNQPQEALEQYKLALRYKPDAVEVRMNLGVALANMGRLPEAIEQFEETAQVKPDSLDAYANLTTAYAAAKRPGDAIAAAEKAMTLARAAGNMALAQQIQTWLTNYRQQRGAGEDPALHSGQPHSSP